jgi:hypothetical protein
MAKTSGNMTDFVDGTNTSQNLVTAIQPTIWSARLRSFNAIGNPTFEVDQRNAGNQITLPAGTANFWAQDRWANSKNAATMVLTSQIATMGQNITVPGTNFCITQTFLNITQTTQQASLAAGEYGFLQQTIEGPRLRELITDVHSASILCITNVSGGLKFALSLRDPGNSRSLVKLCTLSTANVWQLIPLPNLPIFPSAGNFSTSPGNAGYVLSICYACGSSLITPANDVWQNGNFIGAVGMDNLGAKPVNSYLIIAFIQHEPGPLCTTLIDCPFGKNLDGDFGCLRYFSKAGYAYGTRPGTVDTNTPVTQICQAGQHPYQWVPFKKSMAKAPTMIYYSSVTGAANNVRNASSGTDLAVSGSISPGTEGFSSPTFSSPPAGLYVVAYHYTADTGW